MNKNIIGKVKLTPKVHTTAYLEISTNSGNTYTIVDSIEIDASLSPNVYDFPNAPTVDIDNPNLRVKIRVVPDEVPTGGDGITVNAGEDQYLDEGVSTTNFYGNVTINEPGLSVVSYNWSVVTSGVTGVSFSSQTGINTGVTGIPVASRTTFRLTVTDNHGATYTDDIDVSVARPSEMFSSGGYLDNKYDPENQNLRTWVYLPQGYDALKPGGFPLILFLHGTGANGEQTGDDINDLLDLETSLPKFLYEKTYPMQAVVIMPQLHDGFWDLTAAQKALNYAIAGYSIDINKIYVTGYSSGGAGSFELVVGNPTLFSAAIPSNPVSNSVGTTPANAAAIKDVPYLIVGSYNDTQVPPYGDGNIWDDIDNMLAANPQGIYPPLVLMAWDSPHTYDTWGRFIYNKTTAPFDFENDFFLFHSKNLTTTCNNYVTKAEEKLRFYDWSRALLMVNNMPSGNDKTTMLTRLDAVKTRITTDKNHKYYMINLGSNSTFNLYTVNNVASAANNTTVSNLKDTANGSSTKGFTVVSNPAGIVTNGLDHNFMGMGRDMFRTSFLYTSTQPAQWKLTGLDPNKYYDVTLYNSNKSQQLYGTGNMTGTRAELNGIMAQSRLEGYNTMFTTDFYNVKPNSSGEIIMNMSALDNFQANVNKAYQGNTVSILLKEKTTTANPRSNFGKFNMANSGVATHSDWGTLLGDPTASICTATDPVSGWQINTVSTDPAYWQKYQNNYGNDTTATASVYTSIFPEVVSRSGRINYVNGFDKAAQNYNLEVIGTPGMGFPAGWYNVKILSATNSDFNPSHIVCKMGKSNGVMENTIMAKNNTTNYLSYSGYLKDGDTIKIGVFMPLPTWGVAFINAIIVEKVD